MYNISNLPDYLKEPLTILSKRYGFSISEQGRTVSFVSISDPFIDITAEEDTVKIMSNHV